MRKKTRKTRGRRAKRQRKAAGNGTGNGSVTAVQLVRSWKKGGTSREVAARLHMKPQTLAARAARLRALGVKLPKLSRVTTGRRIDVAALNAILRA